MSCLDLKILGYQERIRVFEQNHDENISIRCYSISWTLERKVNTFVIGFLAVVVAVVGGTLYGIGTINLTTMLPMVIAGGVVLLIDFALVLHYLKNHSSFVEEVGKLVDNPQALPQKEQFLFTDFVGKAEDLRLLGRDDADKNKIYGAITYRPRANTYYLEFFQTKKLYDKRAEDFKNQDIFRIREIKVTSL